MVAPVALQQAKFVAHQISQLIQGKDLKKFKYRDKGAMATIGRHKAVVEVKVYEFPVLSHGVFGCSCIFSTYWVGATKLEQLQIGPGII